MAGPTWEIWAACTPKRFPGTTNRIPSICACRPSESSTSSTNDGNPPRDSAVGDRSPCVFRSYRFVSGNEERFRLDRILLPTTTFCDAFRSFDHARVSAEVDHRILGRQIPRARVFADQIIDAACFAAPSLVLPWAADSRNVGQPGNLASHFFEFAG